MARARAAELGEPAPGPFPGLLLPPGPERLASSRRGGSTRSASRSSGPARSSPWPASPTGCGSGRRSAPTGAAAKLAARPRRRSMDDRHGARPGVRRRRRRARRRLPLPEHGGVEPRRRAPRRRRPDARTARTVPPAAWRVAAVARPGRRARARRSARGDGSCRCTDGEHRLADRSADRRRAPHVVRRRTRRGPGVAVGSAPSSCPGCRARRGLHPGGQVVTDRQSRGQPVPAEHAADDRGVFTQWDGKWYRRSPSTATRASSPSGSPTSPARRERRVLPAVPATRRGGSTSSSRAASSTRCSASTSCCRSSPWCSSGCSPGDLYGDADRRAGDGAVRPVPRLVRAVVVVRRSAAHRARRGLPVVPARRERWLLAGIAAALATATRPERHRHRRRLRRRRVHRHHRRRGSGGR